MRGAICALPISVGLVLGLAVQTAPAAANIVLSQASFEAGQNYAAFFKVEHGCDGSPTTALSVEIPDGVTVLDTPQKPGWTLNAERVKDRVTRVTWRGRLDANTADQFGLFMKLPAKTGTVYFPALQQCEKGETRWNEIPAARQTPHEIAHPAPMLELVAAAMPAAQAPAHYMAGDIMIEQPWSTATPGGATTAAAYMTIMNHGSAADTLLGGASPIAGRLEIHQMSMANGIMTMRPVTGGLTIPAGGTVTLGPQGNYHLMLTGLKVQLRQGASVPATLTFAKAGTVQVAFVVAPIGARTPPGPSPSGAMNTMPGVDHH